MPATAILLEAQQLYCISERLDSLAGEAPAISEALIRVAASVREVAVLLELLVTLRLPRPRPS